MSRYAVAILATRKLLSGKHAVAGTKATLAVSLKDFSAAISQGWGPPRDLWKLARTADKVLDPEDFDGALIDAAVIRFVEGHHGQLTWARGDKRFESNEGPYVAPVYAFRKRKLVAIVAPLWGSTMRPRRGVS